MDFIAIGDTAVDEFIRLQEAHVHCDINSESCTICMKWGDKIPFEFSVFIPAVGNAANAAVTAARLGLSSGFVSNVGNDRYGQETIETFKKEGIDTRYIKINDNLSTNHHYVLWFESERTILIKHEAYPYELPSDISPRWIYLSSAGENSEPLHHELAKWLAEHPDTKLAFQPGTFQMKMGKEKLASLYAAAEFVSCNKEEAERILGLPTGTDIKDLLQAMRALGPKIVLITDGTAGAYAFEGEKMCKVPMYPDSRPPYERTGAGDAIASTIVSALALGKPLEEALLWGPINSMSVVQEIGAQKGLLTRAQIEEILGNAPAEYRLKPVE
jgi:ribokinase